MKLDDIENGDLIHVSDDRSNAELLYVMKFKWNNKTGTYENIDVVVNIDIGIEDELLI